jgi:hypothetical protein
MVYKTILALCDASDASASRPAFAARLQDKPSQSDDVGKEILAYASDVGSGGHGH